MKTTIGATCHPSEIELLTSIADISDIGQRCIADLGALFVAIGRLTDDPTIQSLTCSAGYLVEDWRRLIAEEAEPHEQRRKNLLGRDTCIESEGTQ